MSQWTHVAGMIRVDGIGSLVPGVISNEAPSIGVMTPDYDFDTVSNMPEEQVEAYYKERERQWAEAQKSGIPMGSEGSVKWQWIGNDKESHMCRGHYIIHGDLRDYDSAQPIYEWVKNIVKTLKEKNLWIRQIAINVNVEGEPPVFIGNSYNENTHEEEVIMYKVTKVGHILYGQ